MPRKYTRRNTIRGCKKGKNGKKGKKGKKHLKDRRKLPTSNYTIRQPRKKRYSLHAPRLLKRKPKRSFRSMSFMDSSAYSNIMGKQDFKRKVKGHKNIEGQESGIVVDQDNNLIHIQRYPN